MSIRKRLEAIRDLSQRTTQGLKSGLECVCPTCQIHEHAVAALRDLDNALVSHAVYIIGSNGAEVRTRLVADPVAAATPPEHPDDCGCYGCDSFRTIARLRPQSGT